MTQKVPVIKLPNIYYFILEFAILGYCFCSFYHGVLIHWGLKFSFFLITKAFLPEIFLALFVILWFITRPNIQKVDAILLLLIIVAFFASCFSTVKIKTVFIVIRNLFLPLFMFAISSVIYVDKEKMENIYYHLCIFCAIFIILGLVMAIYQKQLGWEATSAYYAGYSFYGINEELSLKINHGFSGFSVPSLTGNSVNFGSLNAFGAIIICYCKRLKKVIRSVLICSALYSIYLSCNKTSLLALALILSIKILSFNSESISRIIKWLTVLIIMFIIAYIYISDVSYGNLYSMSERIKDWNEIFSSNALINLVFPHNAFGFSAGVEAGVGANAWDNAYLYMAFSTGMLSPIILIVSLIKKNKVIKQYRDSMCTDILVLLGLSSISTCIFFGRSMLTISMILIGMFYSSCFYDNEV